MSDLDQVIAVIDVRAEPGSNTITLILAKQSMQERFNTSLYYERRI